MFHRLHFLLCDFLKFLKKVLFIFQRGEGRGRETSMYGCLSCAPPLGTWQVTQTCALDWESNWQPFDSQASTQPLSHTSQGWLFKFLKSGLYPWPGGSVGRSVIPYTKRLWDWFPSGHLSGLTHPVGVSMGGNRLMFLFLSPDPVSPPSFLSVWKINEHILEWGFKK